MEVLIFVAGILVTGMVGAAMILVTPKGAEQDDPAGAERPAEER